ncbi:MAG: hypothetical protein K2Q14_07785 [Gammaproteobacteria bacterium]|nr:hypothetical protein [Gammaproteobacteria bacterium]
MSLQHIEELVANFFRLVKGRMRLFTLEFNLAKISVIPAILLVICLLILTSSAWLTYTAFITYLIYIMTQSLLIGLLGAMLMNFILIGTGAYFFNKFLINMKFMRTRKHFKKLKQDTNHASNNAVKATD